MSSRQRAAQACALLLVLGSVPVVNATYVAGAAPVDTTTVDAVAELAQTEQRLHDVGAAIQQSQEAVNEAIDDVAEARGRAAEATRQVAVRRRTSTDANAAIGAAQRRFDQFAAAAYVEGPPMSYLTAADPEDVIETASDGQRLSEAFAQKVSRLQQSRTDAANKESAARLAQQEADAAAAAALHSQADAVAALTAAQQGFGAQQSEVEQLTVTRNAARARLGTVTAVQADWDGAAVQRDSAEGAGEWDTTLPMVPSANVASDPAAVVNSVLQVASTSARATAELGRSFLSRMGINLGGADGAGITNGAIPRVYGRQASEYVIRRAMSQMGVPYSWGGGNATGPSRGIDSGAGTVGFDCSGIVLYAFAGVGIKLPHYSGSQYNSGRKIAASQMRRGDVIFYGPNASQHEALYLGQGMMLEAPFTGSDVHVSPVRTSGMTPYVTRFIEY